MEQNGVNMEKYDFLKKLGAFFPKKDIQFRLGAKTKDGTKGQAFAYLSARAIQNRLDEVMGPHNWKDHYEMIGNSCVLCTLSLKVDGEWINKQDVSEVETKDSTPEKNAFKGAVSDALKRAAVKWGIGRYIYEYEAQWVTLENNRLPKSLTLPEEFLLDEEKSKKTTPATKKVVPAKDDGKTILSKILSDNQAEVSAFSPEDQKLINTVLTKVLVDNADKKEVVAWVEGDAVTGNKISKEASAWLVKQLKSV